MKKSTYQQSVIDDLAFELLGDFRSRIREESESSKCESYHHLYLAVMKRLVDSAYVMVPSSVGNEVLTELQNYLNERLSRRGDIYGDGK